MCDVGDTCPNVICGRNFWRGSGTGMDIIDYEYRSTQTSLRGGKQAARLKARATTGVWPG